jgi:hypothetical protein
MPLLVPKGTCFLLGPRVFAVAKNRDSIAWENQRKRKISGKEKTMAFFGFFRRWPPIREVTELANFVDQQSAFLVQRYIYDYTHARSGPYSQGLLKRPEFAQAVERSRWTAYPLGLAMVGEMVEGVLQPHAGAERRVVLDPLRLVVLAVFDRYDVPPPLGTDSWQAARDELARKLDQIGTHPPKRVTDIPEPYAERYFNMMPFDKELLTNDVPTTRSYLRLTLTNIRDELVKRMDAQSMATILARLPREQTDLD